MCRDVQMANRADSIAEAGSDNTATPSSPACGTGDPGRLSWRDRWAECWQRNWQLEEENATLRSTIAFQERTLTELKEDVAGMAPVVNRRSVRLLRRLDFVLRLFTRRRFADEQRSPNRPAGYSRSWRALADAVRTTIHRFVRTQQPPSLVISMVEPAGSASDGAEQSLPTRLPVAAGRLASRGNVSTDAISSGHADSFAAGGTAKADEMPWTPATCGGDRTTAADEEAIQLVVLSPVPRSGSTLLHAHLQRAEGNADLGGTQRNPVAFHAHG